MKILREAKRKDSCFEIADEMSLKLSQKLRRHNMSIVGFRKQDRWDNSSLRKEFWKYNFGAKRLYLRGLNEDCQRFNASGEGYDLSQCDDSRNLAVIKQVAVIQKYFKQIKANDGSIGKRLARVFDCLIVKVDCELYVWDFVQTKFSHKSFSSVIDWQGWYYNKRFGDKVLEFFERGWHETYEVRCEHCGSRVVIAYKNDTDLTNIDGKMYCKDCLERLNYGFCDKTGRLGFRELLRFGNTKDRDEVLKTLGLTKKTARYNILKSYLFEKGIKKCDCGNFYMGDFEKCAECRLTVIYPYQTKKLKFFAAKDENTKMFFGIENEIECSSNVNDVSKIINANLGDLVYLKSDASINHGFEIVSYAMTYKKWYLSLERFKHFFGMAVDKGGFSQTATTTGLHIHLSREGFDNKEHLARFAACWYLNKDFTKIMACRDFNHYCSWNDYRAEHLTSYFINHLETLKEQFDDRYNFINFRNSETVEVRLFNGTLRADVVFAHIQLCKLLVDYSKVCQEVKFDSMFQYLKKNAKSKILKQLFKIYEVQNKLDLKEHKKCA